MRKVSTIENLDSPSKSAVDLLFDLGQIVSSLCSCIFFLQLDFFFYFRLLDLVKARTLYLYRTRLAQ